MKLLLRPLLVSLILVHLFCIGGNGQSEPLGANPVITKGPVDLAVSRGYEARMPCTASGRPKPDIKWFKNGKELVYGESRFRVLSDGALWFSKVRIGKRRSDQGVYWCTAKNDLGYARSQNATLTVLFLGRRFIINPQNVSARIHSFAQFDCTPPSGNPTPTIEWRKDLRLIVATNRIEMTSHGDTHFLRIKRAIQSDAGLYTCVAKSSQGHRDSTPAQLIVKLPPSVSLSKNRIEIYEGRDAEVTCSADGIPKPSTRWYKKDETQPVTRFTQDSNGRFKLTVVKRSDAGKYACKATNSEGSSEAIVLLVVKMRPRFLTRPTQLRIGVGQTATLECQVQAELGYRLFWQKMTGAHVEQLIFPRQPIDGRLLASDDGTLTISNVQKKDQATYVCTVISGPETISASARLTVVDNGVPPPNVTLVPANQTVVEGGNFTLTCIALGNPKPQVSWESGANNREITSGTEDVVITSVQHTHKLTLKNVRTSDSGSYRCIASNRGGIRSKLAYVTVTLVPRAPEPPAYVAVFNVTRTSLVLKWKAPPNPPGAPVTSYVVSFDSSQGKNWKVLVRNIQGLKYKVQRLEPDTEYLFRVIAVNRIGAGRPSPASRVVRTKKPISVPKAKTSPQPIDKLLDVKLRLTLLPHEGSTDALSLSWTPVRPASRIRGYYISWRKLNSGRFNPIDVDDPYETTYILKKLAPGTTYEVFVQAYNQNYHSPPSRTESLKTLPEMPIRAPEDVRLTRERNGGILVSWKPSVQRSVLREYFLGYKVTCTALDGTPVVEQNLGANVTSYLITGLSAAKKYFVTVAVRTPRGAGSPSIKEPVFPGVILPNTGTGMKPDPSSNPRAAEDAKTKKGSQNEIIEFIKQPWFIATIGVVLWLILFTIILIVVCKRKRKRRQLPPCYRDQQMKDLLSASRSPNASSMSRTRGDYRDSSFFWGEAEPLAGGNCPQPMKTCCKTANSSMEDDFPNKAEIRPLVAGRGEAIETKGVKNGDVFRGPKDTNLKMDTVSSGYRTAHKEIPLNNEIGRRVGDKLAIPSPRTDDRKGSTRRDDAPKLKIQSAFDVSPVQSKDNRSNTVIERTDYDSMRNNMRNAEIVRTKKFPDADLVNCMENNPQATWKREKMKEAPQVLTAPGEDTLRRKQKFKPLPKLEVLNWADLPAPASKPNSSAGSPPSSPKMMSSAASAYSENVDSRAPSRISQGSASSLSRYPYGIRSAQAPSMVSSRRLSQSSSMLSSELYQSEMDPSVYSDAGVSDRKRAKTKAIPPPIELDGVTSDILLQWAESVTNSSPSSSGSSSPSRLSGISSDGSFLTDEDFAQAVAAVVECQGFMDYGIDYSLSNMPSLSNGPRSTSDQYRHKIDRIDAMIANKCKASRNTPNSLSAYNQHKARQDTCSPPSVPPLSFSSYLSGPPKRGAGSIASAPGGPQPQSSKFRGRSNRKDDIGLHYGDVESASVASTPLTMSNLRQHDSSLERDKPKQPAKPLTISNLRQHDSSLDRNRKPKGSLDRKTKTVPPAAEDEVFDNNNVAKSVNNTDASDSVAQPLSVTSALERNESMSSTKDSSTSISEAEGRGTSERRKDKKEKKYVVNLKDPNCSTSSTASTVRSSPDQTDC